MSGSPSSTEGASPPTNRQSAVREEPSNNTTRTLQQSRFKIISGWYYLLTGSLTMTEEGADGLLSPALFSARTLNSYSIPSVRSLTVNVVLATVML